MQLLSGWRIAIRKTYLSDTNWETAKSLYNLKQEEGEEHKAREFNANKGWFDNFRKRFGLKTVKITGEAASANAEAADKFPDGIKKIIEEKEYLPDRFLVQMKMPSSGGGKKPQRTLISKREKQAPGFKAGRERLSLLFCENAVRFMTRTALLY